MGAERVVALAPQCAARQPTRLRRRKYLSVSLLMIDETGFEPMERHEASLFFRPVSYRYGRGSCQCRPVLSG